MRKLIEIEPRLIEKSKDKIYNMLVMTTAKSLEAGLISLAVQKYSDDEKIFELAVKKIDNFLSSEDLNLNVVGFQLLYPLLEKKPNLLGEYTSLLTKKAKI